MEAASHSTPVINAPTLQGQLTVEGNTQTLVKSLGEDLYIFAGSAQSAGQKTNFSLSCDVPKEVEVLGEDRTITTSGGMFTDSFADGNSIHLYKLTNAGC